MRKNTVALYSQIACAYNYGASIGDLCESFQRGPVTIYQALNAHGIAGRPKRLRNDDACSRAIAAYKSGTSTPKIAEEMRISRERVCQYLRPGNHISLKHERDKMAREALKAEQSALVAAAKEEHEAKLAAGIELVRGGLSYPKACRRIGLLYPGAQNALAKACHDAGVINMNGRWRDFSVRIARVRELRAQGMKWVRILEIVAAEEGRPGRPVAYQWLQRHVPDLLGTP